MPLLLLRVTPATSRDPAVAVTMLLQQWKLAARGLNSDVASRPMLGVFFGKRRAEPSLAAVAVVVLECDGAGPGATVAATGATALSPLVSTSFTVASAKSCINRDAPVLRRHGARDSNVIPP